MSGTFVGFGGFEDYTTTGERSAPCVGAIFSMLGAGSISACHQALVEAGISQPDGATSIPGEGVRVTILEDELFSTVTIDPPELGFDATDLLNATSPLFEAGKAVICAVKLDGSDDPESMHFIVIGGEARDEAGEVTERLVGDSLLDGIQRVSTEDLVARIGDTIDSMGATWYWPVSVEHTA